MALEDEGDYQEWKECNEKITKLDTILIDLRRYGFTVATGLMTAGSVLGLQTFAQFQPFQIVIILATMALIDVLYWLDVYYQTILSAIILRTQVLEKKLSFGVGIYISRFYMRHKIGKALHLLYLGFLVSLAIIGWNVVVENKLDIESGIPFFIWIMVLFVPIGFVFCIYAFFDRARYKTYREAQVIISNYLRCTRPPGDYVSLDQRITELLDSDKEDLGLDLKTDEWVFFDVTGSCRVTCLLWSHRLILTTKRAYGITSDPFRHVAKEMEYDSIEKELHPNATNSSILLKIKERGSEPPRYIFEIKLPYDAYQEFQNEIRQNRIEFH